MPQPLLRPQPTSSVAAMLERGVGASVVAKPQSAATPDAPALVQSTPTLCDATPSHTAPASIPRQFLLSVECDTALKAIQLVFADAAGIHLRQSELLRAILIAMDQLLPGIRREATNLGRMRRPKNDRQSEQAQEALERRIADVLLTACRVAGRSAPP